MRTAAARQDGIAGFDRKWFPVNRHDSVAASKIINLVRFLQVITNGRAFVQHAFAKRELQVRRFLKKDIPGRRSAAVMWSGFILRNLDVALNEVTVCWCLLRRKRDGHAGTEGCHERQYH